MKLRVGLTILLFLSAIGATLAALVDLGPDPYDLLKNMVSALDKERLDVRLGMGDDKIMNSTRPQVTYTENIPLDEDIKPPSECSFGPLFQAGCFKEFVYLRLIQEEIRFLLQGMVRSKNSERPGILAPEKFLCHSRIKILEKRSSSNAY